MNGARLTDASSQGPGRRQAAPSDDGRRRTILEAGVGPAGVQRAFHPIAQNSQELGAISRASISGSDGGLAEPAKPPVHADQNLVDALVHTFDEEMAIGENECFVPIPETHMIPLQPH